MILQVPDATPVTTPVAEPTVATAVLLLVQVPLDIVELRVVVDPTHTDAVPVIDTGLYNTAVPGMVLWPPVRVLPLCT